MIVWIASYPRSGNSLFRQLIHATMGQPSHERGNAGEIRADYADFMAGFTHIIEDPEDFFARARDTEKPVFVKTHDPPQDDSPAVYLVRDGRSATVSFLRYEQNFAPENQPTLLSLIVGDHHYGSWSDHYRAWHNRHAPILTLAYPDIFNADDALIARVAEFVGYKGERKPWENMIDEWRERYPLFVGPGKVRWDPTPEWDYSTDVAFWRVHGELMRELGLDDGWRRSPSGESDVIAITHLVDSYRSSALRLHEMQAAAVEKESALGELRRELELQTRAAAERLELIEQLSHERDVQAAAAAERLALLNQLHHEAETDPSGPAQESRPGLPA